MPMTIRPPSNAIERLAECERRLGRVEVMGLGREVLDGLGDDARPGGDHEEVVVQVLASCQVDELSPLVDPNHLADDQRDAPVEERELRAFEPFGPLSAHRDVHEPRLVDMPAGRVDEDHVHLAALDAAAQALHEEVRGERPADAAAQDDDALHGDQRRFSTMIVS